MTHWVRWFTYSSDEKIHSYVSVPEGFHIMKRQHPALTPDQVDLEAVAPKNYPTWLCQQFATENGHRNSEFSH